MLGAHGASTALLHGCVSSNYASDASLPSMIKATSQFGSRRFKTFVETGLQFCPPDVAVNHQELEGSALPLAFQLSAYLSTDRWIMLDYLLVAVM